MPRKNPDIGLLSLYIFLSGFAGLGYEMLWTRMLSVSLGQEIVAVVAVLAAFFCGTACGAWSLDGVVSRSRKPGHWYALLEVIIGGWSVALVFLTPWFNNFAPKFVGVDPSAVRQWTISFLFPFLLLLPATFAMGGSLPAIERFFSRLRRDGWSVGGVYAANTLGAVAGTLVTTFLIAPRFGFRATLFMLAGVNLVCASGVVALEARDRIHTLAVFTSSDKRPVSQRLLMTLFLTGLLGIGYEILVVRVLNQVLENTIYSFASVLSIYLLGTAVGAALYQICAPRESSDQLLTRLLLTVSGFCLMGVLLLPFAENIFAGVYEVTGGGLTGSFMGELSLSFAVFFLPTAAMGATFSHLAQAVRGPKGGLGRALCLNTLGAALAPLLFCVILLPWFGSRITLVVASTGYLLLVPKARSLPWMAAATILALAVFCLWHPADYRFVRLPPGGTVAAHMEGVTASVTVVKDEHGEYRLKVNNKFEMGGTSSSFSDRRQGHLPLLLHSNPKKALFLGLGTGTTFAACADYPGLEAEGVELIPEILPMLPYFEKATGNFAHYPRLNIKVADARRFVKATQNTYDVIVADLFHPARDGAGSLYTVEHFAAIRARLNPGGVFCQWLPLYQLDLEMIRVIIRTFLHVFPEGSAFVAHYSLQTPILGLVAGTGPLRYPADWFERRVTEGALFEKLRAVRLNSQYELFGCFAAANRDLTAFAGGGPCNTDEYPLVTFGAPHFVYQNPRPPYERLLVLLNRFQPHPEEIMETAATDDARGVQQRLASYWSARNSFLKAGVGVPQTDDVRELLINVREPLLSVVRTSPDFSAAYNPLLAMAYRLHGTNPEGSRELLLDLEKANPNRNEARHLRLQLFSHGSPAAQNNH